jgi:hypothetical protein
LQDTITLRPRELAATGARQVHEVDTKIERSWKYPEPGRTCRNEVAKMSVTVDLRSAEVVEGRHAIYRIALAIPYKLLIINLLPFASITFL